MTAWGPHTVLLTSPLPSIDLWCYLGPLLSIISLTATYPFKVKDHRSIYSVEAPSTLVCSKCKDLLIWYEKAHWAEECYNKGHKELNKQTKTQVNTLKTQFKYFIWDKDYFTPLGLITSNTREFQDRDYTQSQSLKSCQNTRTGNPADDISVQVQAVRVPCCPHLLVYHCRKRNEAKLFITEVCQSHRLAMIKG